MSQAAARLAHQYRLTQDPANDYARFAWLTYMW